MWPTAADHLPQSKVLEITQQKYVLFTVILYTPYDMILTNTPHCQGDAHNLEPGSYCSEFIEGLLLPVIEAARGLTNERTQVAFLMLTINVFLSELRKSMTANKKTYW